MSLELNVINSGELIINFREQTVFYIKEEIKFTNREFQIFFFLAQHKGQVFSKRQIYNYVTEAAEKANFHTIEITISRIRRSVCACRKIGIVWFKP